MGCSPDVCHLKSADASVRRAQPASCGGNKELGNIYINVKARGAADNAQTPSHLLRVHLRSLTMPVLWGARAAAFLALLSG